MLHKGLFFVVLLLFSCAADKKLQESNTPGNKNNEESVFVSDVVMEEETISEGKEVFSSEGKEVFSSKEEERTSQDSFLLKLNKIENFPPYNGKLVGVFLDDENDDVLRISKVDLGISDYRVSTMGTFINDFEILISFDNGDTTVLEGDELIVYHDGIAVTRQFDVAKNMSTFRSYHIINHRAKLINSSQFPVFYLTGFPVSQGNILLSDEYMGAGGGVGMCNIKLEGIVKYAPFYEGHTGVLGYGYNESLTALAFSDINGDSLCITTFNGEGKLINEYKYTNELNGFIPNNIFIEDDFFILYGPFRFQKMETIIIDKISGEILWRNDLGIGINDADNNYPIVFNNLLISTHFEKGVKPPVSLRCYDIENQNYNIKWEIRSGQFNRHASFNVKDHERILGPRIVSLGLYKNKIIALVSQIVSGHSNECFSHQVDRIVVISSDDGSLVQKIPIKERLRFPFIKIENGQLNIYSGLKKYSYEIVD